MRSKIKRKYIILVFTIFTIAIAMIYTQVFYLGKYTCNYLYKIDIDITAQNYGNNNVRLRNTSFLIDSACFLVGIINKNSNIISNSFDKVYGNELPGYITLYYSKIRRKVRIRFFKLPDKVDFYFRGGIDFNYAFAPTSTFENQALSSIIKSRLGIICQ